MARIRLFRYRRPSVKTMLGVTKAKKRINKQLGISVRFVPLVMPNVVYSVVLATTVDP